MRSATGFLDFRTDHTSVIDDVAKPCPQNGFRGKFYVSEGKVSRLARLHGVVKRKRKMKNWGGRRALLIYLHRHKQAGVQYKFYGASTAEFKIASSAVGIYLPVMPVTHVT